MVVKSVGSASTTLRYSSIAAGSFPCSTYFSAVRKAFDLLRDIHPPEASGPQHFSSAQSEGNCGGEFSTTTAQWGRLFFDSQTQLMESHSLKGQAMNR